VNRLADDIREDYPDVMIHTFAYQYTKKAPIGLKTADNVIVRLCNIECSWDTSMKQQAVEQILHRLDYTSKPSGRPQALPKIYSPFTAPETGSVNSPKTGGLFRGECRIGAAKRSPLV